MSGPKSSASTRVRPRSPALAASYAVCSSKLTREWTEAVLTMLPPPVSLMAGTPNLALRNTVFKPTSRVRSQSFSSSSVALPLRNQMALLWMMSSRPKALAVRSIIRFT